MSAATVPTGEPSRALSTGSAPAAPRPVATRLRIPVLVLSIVLISAAAIGGLLTVRQQREVRAVLDESLAASAKHDAAALAHHFERTRAVDLLLSRHPSFAAAYDDPDDLPRSGRFPSSVRASASQALGYLETLYPGSIGEACFIDRGGSEIARVVAGTVASQEELSMDESENAFFAPAFATPVGQVFHSRPYVSPDTGEWVISVATPIASADRVKRALVHFEVTVDSFRSVLGSDTMIVERSTGGVVLDSSVPQTIGAPLGGDRQVTVPRGSAGWADRGADRVAFHSVTAGADGANDWVVIARAPAQPLLPPLPLALLLALALAGLALLGLARRGFVEARRELESARDAAVSAVRVKADFLANMSHEIRTPMNGVIGLTGLLIDSGLDERQLRYAEGVRSAGDALLVLINDILDFSKIEAGKLELEETDFDLVQVVEEAAQLVAPGARAKGLELVAYCFPGLPVRLRGDSARIRQVMLNLVSNAVKFTDAGEVVMRAEMVAETTSTARVRFEVKDTGIGIAEADRARLFQSFVQADPSTTRRFGGTGLGLTISQQLVRAMGGDLQVESSLGQGSTFFFTLELAKGEVVSADPFTPYQHLLEGQRALVVDDNRTNRLILSEQLRAWHMLTELAEDGPAALEMLSAAARRGRPYDVVLLDMCMPGMDGLELARRIEAAAVPRPILVLLTSSDDLPLADVRAAGVAVSLPKPVPVSRLYDALMRVTAPARTPEPDPVLDLARPTASRGRVLVAEDNVTNQMVAVGILARLGYSAEVVSNGLEALDALALRSYAAVLMDCQMPEMDGYQATGELRRREGAARRTPIIAMTAGAMEGDRERCLASGMDDYLPKPVIWKDLATVLTRWVRESSVQEAAPAAAPAEAPGPPPGVLDDEQLHMLRDLAPGDTSVLDGFVASYLRTSPLTLAAIRDAVAAGAADDLAFAAHKLKGSAGTLGTPRVAEVCADLERCGRDGDLGPAGPMVARLERELDRAWAALRALQASTST